MPAPRYALIDQLLSYALLALRDGHPVTHIAAYLARYELLVHYPVQEVLDELASAPLTRRSRAPAWQT